MLGFLNWVLRELREKPLQSADAINLSQQTVLNKTSQLYLSVREVGLQEHCVLRRHHQPGQPLELRQLGRQLSRVHAQGQEVQRPLSGHILLLQVWKGGMLCS